MKKLQKFIKTFFIILQKKTNLDRQLISDSSLDYLFNHFGTDKGSKVVDLTLVVQVRYLVMVFQSFMKKIRSFKDDLFNILEIGTWKGASVVFLNYFPQSNVFGIDKNFKMQGKIKTF